MSLFTLNFLKSNHLCVVGAHLSPERSEDKLPEFLHCITWFVGIQLRWLGLGASAFLIFLSPLSGPYLFIFLNYLLFLCVCVHMRACVCARAHTRAHSHVSQVWKSKDNFWELLLSFHLVGPKDRTLAVGPGFWCPHHSLVGKVPS